MSDQIIEDLKWLLAETVASGGGEYRESKVILAAIAEIETLRADAVLLKNIGRPSFREIKQGVDKYSIPMSGQEIKNGPSV